jgi:hypothetical protein
MCELIEALAPPRPCSVLNNPDMWGPFMSDRKALSQRLVAVEVERELRRRLILQIIDVGVRSMATKLHPEAGGSDQDMSRLQECKETLRAPYAKLPRLTRDLRARVKWELADLER